MPKINFVLLFILFFINVSIESIASEIYKTCTWDNKNKIPCLEINTHISNSSEHSRSGIEKIVISKKQINETGAVDLIDALKLVSDINITQSGPKGQQASIFMRGTGSNHTLVMINGVPINDQSTTQGLHDFGVDFIQTVQQIEVYPGSSASHFGANSIGGAINIILTGDYKDSISLVGDKNSNYEFFANKNYISNQSSLNLKIGSVKNESISARGNIDDEIDGVTNYTANINYERYINPNLKIYNTAYLRETVTGYDISETNQIGYEGDNKMGLFQLGLENFDSKQKQNCLFYYNIYDRKYDEAGTIDKYESEVVGLKYDLSKTLSKKLSFGLGSEYKYDWGSFDNKGSYSASTKGNLDNFSIYSNFGFNIFNNTNLSLFLRNDKHKQTGNNSSYKINFNQVVKNFQIGLSRMTGLRNPTLYELFGTDNYGYSGNINLDAEKSITNEIYGKYLVNEYLTFSTKLFRSNISNNIEYESNKYVNDNDDVDLNQSGINSDIFFKKKNTSLNFFTSFLSSEKENSEDQLRRPEKSYGLNLFKRDTNNIFGEFDFGISYNHYGKHFDTHSTNFNIIEMDSTDIVNLNIIKKLNESTLYLKFNNLFDESFQRPHGYNQEKRKITFGIKY